MRVNKRKETLHHRCTKSLEQSIGEGKNSKNIGNGQKGNQSALQKLYPFRNIKNCRKKMFVIGS